MKQLSTRERGFAMVTAIFGLVLVSSLMLAMMTTLVADARRTVRLRGDVQIQQLLLAGQEFATGQLMSDSIADNAELVMPLPQAISADAKVVVKGERVASQVATVKVSASIGGLTRTHTLKYTKRDAHWTMQSATMEPL